jgi:hypothetical protein
MQMTKNESAIEQINLGYNEQEDRLLLKLGLVDKTEIAVWVTRRVCKLMWGLLQNTNSNSALPLVAPTVAPQSVASSHKEQVIQNFAREVAEQKSIENMDFKSEYLTDRQTRTDEPMLAVQCVIIIDEELSAGKPKPPTLELQCTNGQAVKMALNNELVLAVTNMMQLATREAGWDLLMTNDKSQTGPNPIQQVLH